MNQLQTECTKAKIKIFCRTCKGDKTITDNRAFGAYKVAYPKEICCPDCKGTGVYTVEKL